jgi:transmembrane sensor
MDIDDINRILDGSCSDEERALFFERVAKDKELAKAYAEAKNRRTFDSMPNTATSRPLRFDSDGVLRIGKEGDAPEGESPKTEGVTAEKKAKTGFWYYAIRVAAALFIPLAIYVGYDVIAGSRAIGSRGGKEFATVKSVTVAGMSYVVNNGVRGKAILPDSTIVWLNCGSTLDVPEKFDDDRRVVSLSGEGYFEVKKDKSKPFYIKTPKNILVKVTGTEFNLQCYASEPNFTLTLVNGSVELLRERKETIIVQPKEEITITDKADIEKSSAVADIDHATSWMSGRLIFDDTPMSEVVTRLERWYGVDITVKDPAVLNASFTAEFKSESIIQVLDLLKITSDIEYKVNGTDITLSSAGK